MYWAEYKGVFFVEGMPTRSQIIKSIDTKLDGVFTQSQLKSLDAIKDKMIVAVRDAGGNAVVDFKYGQRTSFWSSFVSLDDVRWFATGKIAVVPAESLTANAR